MLIARTWEESNLHRSVLHARGIKDNAPPIEQQVLLDIKRGDIILGFSTHAHGNRLAVLFDYISHPAHKHMSRLLQLWLFGRMHKDITSFRFALQLTPGPLFQTTTPKSREVKPEVGDFVSEKTVGSWRPIALQKNGRNGNGRFFWHQLGAENGWVGRNARLFAEKIYVNFQFPKH